MTRYAIYDSSTGTILRIVQCAPGQALAQLATGEALLPAGPEVNDLTHRVEAGVLVSLA